MDIVFAVRTPDGGIDGFFVATILFAIALVCIAHVDHRLTVSKWGSNQPTQAKKLKWWRRRQAIVAVASYLFVATGVGIMSTLPQPHEATPTEVARHFGVMEGEATPLYIQEGTPHAAEAINQSTFFARNLNTLVPHHVVSLGFTDGIERWIFGAPEKATEFTKGANTPTVTVWLDNRASAIPLGITHTTWGECNWKLHNLWPVCNRAVLEQTFQPSHAIKVAGPSWFMGSHLKRAVINLTDEQYDTLFPPN